MRRLITTLFLAVLILVFGLAAIAAGQEASPIRFATMTEAVRDTLIKEWDLYNKDSLVVERGYCGYYQFDIWASEKAYLVTTIERADSVDAHPGSVSFKCRKAWNLIEIHVHPPFTCIDSETPSTCWRGGPYAWQCLPSDQDVNYLSWANQPFGMVQCTREGVVSYFKRPPRIVPEEEWESWE